MNGSASSNINAMPLRLSKMLLFIKEINNLKVFFASDVPFSLWHRFFTAIDELTIKETQKSTSPNDSRDLLSLKEVLQHENTLLCYQLLDIDWHGKRASEAIHLPTTVHLFLRQSPFCQDISHELLSAVLTFLFQF